MRGAVYTIHAPLHVHSAPNLIGSYLPSSIRFSPKATDESIHVGRQTMSNRNLFLKRSDSVMEASTSTVDMHQDEEDAMRRETNAQAKAYFAQVFPEDAGAATTATASNPTSANTPASPAKPAAAIAVFRDQSDSFPNFLRYQVLDGKILGKGAFCNVSEVRGFQHLNGPPAFFKRNKFPSQVKKSAEEPKKKKRKGQQQQEEEHRPVAPVALGAFLQDNIKSSSLFLSHNKWVPSVVSRFAGTGNPFSSSHGQRQQQQQHMDHYVEDEEVLKESRDFISDHCFRAGGDSRYAIKSLSNETMGDPGRLLQGIVDMAMEARILSNLTNHPNVIKMRAISQGGPFGGSDGFFIVLDRLYDTLEQRLETWNQQVKRLKGWGARFRRDPQGVDLQAQLYEDRLVAAFDLSSAIAYLHRNRILHRDLKPQNIGFDIRGDLKIFDFGLAKVMPPTVVTTGKRGTAAAAAAASSGEEDANTPIVAMDESGRYAFTAMCGTMRYMAPEVGLGQNYNECCDIFSFTILLWEIMALERPYGTISPEELQEQVWLEHRRPPLDSPRAVTSSRGRNQSNKIKSRNEQQGGGARQLMSRLLCQSNKKNKSKKPWASTPLQILMKRGWSSNPDERPRMKHVEAILRKECISFRNGDESGLEHNQRRSTHVFHRSKQSTPFQRSKTSRTL